MLHEVENSCMIALRHLTCHVHHICELGIKQFQNLQTGLQEGVLDP